MWRVAIFVLGSAYVMLLISGCRRAAKIELPRYVIIYYDRNQDGVVDLELHHAPGWTDSDWGLVDNDYNASYDGLFVNGAVGKCYQVEVPVPGGVPITKEVPKELGLP